LVVVAGVSSAFGVRWFVVPTVGHAAFTGLKAALIGGLAAGVVGGVATVAVARGDKQQAHWSPRIQRAARPAGSIIVGLVIGVAAWSWFQTWLAVGLGIIAAILAAVSVQYVRRFRTETDFRRASAAGIVVGSMLGLAFGVLNGVLELRPAAGLRWGVTWGIMAGVAAGIGTMLKGRSGDRPARGTRWSLRKGWLAAAVTGAAAALIGILGGGSAFGLSFGLIFGVTSAIAVVALAGFEGVPGDLSAGASPLVVLARDRSATFSLTLVTIIAAGIAAGIVAAAVAYSTFSPMAQPALAFGLGMATSAGLTIGAGFGLVVGGFGSTWPGWLTARAWLALRGHVPWSLMSFLADAHHRAVLRQAGAVYQFRHIDLQHRLATRAGPLTVVIEGSDLPGLTCPSDAAGEHHNVHIALYTKSKQRPTLVIPGDPWLATEPVPGDAPSARWEIPVTVRRDEDGFDFSGPYVRGDRGNRHLGLAWGDIHDDGTLQLIRSSNLRLTGIDPRLVEEAMRPGHQLVARIWLTNTQGKTALTWSARPAAGKPD
jgi:hypothetical protein